MAGLQTPNDAAAAQLIAEAWRNQHRIGEAHRQADGLPARLGTGHPALLRNARIVEAFWQCRYGRPSAERVAELAQDQHLAHGAGDVRFEAIASLALAQWHSQNYRHQEALANAQVAFALCTERQPEERFDRVVALNSLGVYHSYLMAWSEALDCLYQGLHWAVDLLEPGLEATLHANLGTIFFSTGNVLDAWAAFERAESLRPPQPAGPHWLQPGFEQGPHPVPFGPLAGRAGLRATAVGRIGAHSAHTTRMPLPLRHGPQRHSDGWRRRWIGPSKVQTLRSATRPPTAWPRHALRWGNAHLAAGGHSAARDAFTAAKAVLGTQGEVFYRLEAEEGLAAAARGAGDHAAAVAALDASIALREAVASLATRTQVAATRIRGRLDELKLERNRARQAQVAAEANLQALRRTQAELLQMQQRAMASKLMASLAHQVNTPLGTCITANSSQHDGLLGLMQQMQHNALRRSELQDALRRSVDNADLIGANLARLERLMRRFGLFGTERFLTQEELPSLMADAVSSAARRAGLDPNQCFELAVAPVTVQCDAAALHGLLAELLDNALAARRPSDPPIAVSAASDGAGVRIDIADRGPGMSDAHCKRALNPYSTPPSTAQADADSLGLGLGLGWPIVNHLARHVLLAEIGLQASPEDGTRVRLQLPLKPD